MAKRVTAMEPQSGKRMSQALDGMLLTNSDLSSHAVNQLLGIVADS